MPAVALDVPAAVVGTATIFCRPLRYLFDVESSIAILRNTATDAKSSEELDDVLGYVHAHVSISTSRDATGSNGRVQDNEVTDDSNQPSEELAGLVGRFVWVRVRLQLVPEERVDPAVSSSRMRVQYQLCSATESFLLPVDHTNTFKVLVTQELLTYISTKALQFNFLVPEQREDSTQEAKNASSAAEPVVVAAGGLSAEDAEAARRATSAAAMAAESAAQAAREAAAAAKAAIEAAMASQAKEVERQRDDSKSRAVQNDILRALETDNLQRDRELARQQHEHELQLIAEEKQRLADAASRLEHELQEKQRTMDKWTQQTATTDQAIELLKQRLASDAKEREELQRRLRVLEEEKQELLRKSRACVVQ